MGHAMALRWQRSMAGSGESLMVWNRTRSKASISTLESAGAVVADTFEALVEVSDTVCLMVLGSEAVSELIARLLATVAAQQCSSEGCCLQTVVCFSTVSPDCAAAAAAACAAAGVGFVCAPVSGSCGCAARACAVRARGGS